MLKRYIVIAVVSYVMLVFGFFISSEISDRLGDETEKYYKSLKIDDHELFEYGMRTNAGYAFVYGDYRAADPVGFEEISGEFSSVKKVEEHYNMHTRLVTKTKTANGKTTTYTETEIYYSWDYAGEEEKSCTKIVFCGVEFDADKIKMPQQRKIEKIQQSPTVRFIYYASPAESSGTIFAKLENGSIPEQSVFIEGKKTEEAKKYLVEEIEAKMFIFWIMWIGYTLSVSVIIERYAATFEC